MPNRRVLVVQNVPTPYRLPLFAEMNRQFGAAGLDLLVVFGAGGYPRRRWTIETAGAGFRFQVLESRALTFGGNPERTTFTYAGLGGVVRRFKPDLVIVAGFSLATVKVLVLSFLHRFPYIIWSGSVPSGTRLDSRLRRFQRRLLARRACAAVAYGSLSRQYLISLGIPPDRVFVGLNTTDTDFFAAATERLRTDARNVQRQVLTYVGYLTARKNVLRVLEVIRELGRRRRDFVLEIVGDGEDRARLEQFVRDEGLDDVVTFHGYRQRDELPQFFARSSAFLFQTDRDIWGLVLNEAMAAGVPCLASRHAGATHDLVRDADTGFIVDFDDIDQVCERLAWLLDQPAEARSMGRRARAFVADHASLAASAKGFTDAARACLETP